MDLRARTAARRNDAATGVSICRSTRSSRVTSISRWRRITTDGRGVTHAAAASREPPSSRRWRRGWASENPRALTSEREARKTRKSISSSSESATGGPSTREPSMSSSRTLSWPVMMMFSTRSSSTSGWSRPSRNSESKTARASASCSDAGQGRHPGVHPVGDGGLDQVEHDRASQLLLRDLVEPTTVGRDRLTELLGGLRAQGRDERPVDGCCRWVWCSRSTGVPPVPPGGDVGPFGRPAALAG